ncbi:MAG: MFS transporter [Anaerolineae bacterium]
MANPSAPSINRWFVLAVICIPVFVGSLDLTVVSAFLPELILDLEIPLQTGLDDAAWIVSAYLLAYTVSLTFTGRLSDLIGRRAVYAVCLIIFIIGSVMVAVAHQWPTDFIYTIYRRLGDRPDIAYVNLQAIILGRIVQAIGAGALVPVSLALVGDMFPPNKRAQPMGLVGAIDTLGWVLGHLYGGIFVQFAPWQGLFWVNVPLTLFALVVTLYALRNVPQQRVKGRFDFLGTALIIGALTAMNIGLGANIDLGVGNINQLSTIPPYALPLLSLALVFFLLFILVESRVRDPLINLNMFRRRNIVAGSLTNLFVGYCLFIGLVAVPILVNIRQGDTSTIRQAALQVGLLLSALTVPMAVATIPGGWLSERIGYSRTTLIGLGLSVIGFLMVWQTWTVDVSDVLIIIEMAIIGVGLGLTFSPISTSVINAARDEERGVASALVLILRLIGIGLSSSSLATYAINRVNALAVAELGEEALNTSLYVDTYARITVGVLAELGLLGAILSLIAMIPAALMRGDAPSSEPEPDYAAPVTGRTLD